MSRRTLLLLAALCGVLAMSRADGAEPDPKLTAKYRLEFEIRKPGAPRTITAEAFHDETSKRLYYVGADNKSLAMTACPVPDAAKDVVRPKWVRGFDLKARAWGADVFTAETPTVTVEVFRDASAKRLVYVSESGALAVLPEPPAAKDAKRAPPRHLYRLQLKIRPSGENDFTRNYLKLSVEVYVHEPTGHLIYVGHNGALAVVESKKQFGEMKVNPARWSHAMELRARRPNANEFNRDTPRIGVEVYVDDNAGVVLYATETLGLAAVPGVVEEKRNAKPPRWQNQLLTGKFAAEIYSNPNAGHVVVMTDAGALAALP